MLNFRNYVLLDEALKIVKKFKDRLKDDDSSAYDRLLIGKVQGFSIKKSVHNLDDRDDVRRDKGVPEKDVLDIIYKVFDRLKNNKETVVVFKYKEKWNMIILAKKPKYKEVVIITQLLQNRNSNTFRHKKNDDVILLEHLKNSITNEDLDIIILKD